MTLPLKLVKKKFGRLVVLEKFGSDKHQKVLWRCMCKCGNEHIARASDLMSKKIVSCGCFREKVLKTHGHSGERLYRIWHGVVGRTKYPNKNYSDKGVSVQKRWLNYLHFRKDLIDSYENHVKEFGEINTTLDRINPFGNYELRNVRWATKKEQANNTRKMQDVS